ncbi:MAG: N-acetylmuramidase family protein [Mesorhizobium sp.]
MFTRQTIAEIAAVAAEFQLEPAALLALAEVESDGVPFADVDGRQEPPIRFEGHWFDRRLSVPDRLKARAAGLASPFAGRIANPRAQAARWRLLARAASIDRRAAHEACSWGIGQVMGGHWAALGYADIDELVAEARSGAAGQARLMARYILWAGLRRPLARHDWRSVARGYNGPEFARLGYDRKLVAAYERHAAARRPTAPATRPARRSWRSLLAPFAEWRRP